MREKDYKAIAYETYVSTHISPRKGEDDQNKLMQRANAFKQHFKGHLPGIKTGKIADLGCGSGSLVWWLNTEGYSDVVGIDISEEQIKIANKLGIKNVYVGDVFEFLYSCNDDFEIIFARDLMEHFTKEQVVKFLDLCKKRLTDKGKLILQVPNAESPYFGRVLYGDFTHELAFTQYSANQLLRSRGFANVSVFPWRPVVGSFKSMIRYIVWRIIEIFLILPIFVETGGTNHIVTKNIIVTATK